MIPDIQESFGGAGMTKSGMKRKRQQPAIIPALGDIGQVKKTPPCWERRDGFQMKISGPVARKRRGGFPPVPESTWLGHPR